MVSPHLANVSADYVRHGGPTLRLLLQQALGAVHTVCDGLAFLFTQPVKLLPREALFVKL